MNTNRITAATTPRRRRLWAPIAALGLLAASAGAQAGVDVQLPLAGVHAGRGNSHVQGPARQVQASYRRDHGRHDNRGYEHGRDDAHGRFGRHDNRGYHHGRRQAWGHDRDHHERWGHHERRDARWDRDHRRAERGHDRDHRWGDHDRDHDRHDRDHEVRRDRHDHHRDYAWDRH